MQIYLLECFDYVCTRNTEMAETVLSFEAHESEKKPRQMAKTNKDRNEENRFVSHSISIRPIRIRSIDREEQDGNGR